nr:MAG TPA: hypothetical protein [Caudoviricetes sp.]
MCKFYFDYCFLNAHYRFYVSKISLAFLEIRTSILVIVRKG